MAQAIGYPAIKQGCSCSIVRSSTWFATSCTTKPSRGTTACSHKYLKPDLLIVDDMGMKNLPRRSGEILFEIIMRRYETRSTMMTSNRPLEDWGKLTADVPSATAILDRFLHHATVIPISGRSYRLRNPPGTSAEPSPEDAAESKSAIPPTGKKKPKTGNEKSTDSE